MRRTRFHKLVYFVRDLLVVTVPTLAGLAIVLELFFRFVIPVSNEPFRIYDQGASISRYDTANGPSEGLFTAGWASQLRSPWKLNNHGWNSDVDYTAVERGKPLIAIIGDSFIEGLQAPPDKNVASVLRRKLKGKFDVYSFGVSHAALGAYLQISRHVAKEYRPKIMVINVVHNDFLLLCQDSGVPGLLCLRIQDGKVSELIPELPSPSFLQRVARRITSSSALVRFVRVHLNKVEPSRFHSEPDAYNGNIEVNKVLGREDEIGRAVDYCIRKMKEENPGTTLIVVMDARRQDIYHNKVKTSNIEWLHDLLERVCRENDVYYVDLTGPFADEHRSTGTRFESEWDYHWNEQGHRAAADALFGKLKKWDLVH
jgi:lysophospholipase L1-like esterase